MRRWVTILVTILAVSLLATGCFGGDDDDTTTSERPEDGVTTTTLAQPGVTTSTTLATPATTPTPEPTPTRIPGQPLTYEVQPGDLLGTIAQQFGVTVDAIVAANNLENPDVITVGQELIIPPPEDETAGETTEDTTAGDATADG